MHTSYKLHRFRRLFNWNRSSLTILSVFLLTISLIVFIWWPLAEEQLSYWVPGVPWWWQIDWLLIGNFMVMSLLIMVGADLKHDIWIVAVGLAGGLAIEGWGTQTELCRYYTNELSTLFTVMVHGMVAVSVWRVMEMTERYVRVWEKRMEYRCQSYKGTRTSINFWVFDLFLIHGSG